MTRYQQLIDMIRAKKPKHVIETGTCGGKRARQFMAVSNCYYTGFDLFEDATPESDKKEMNAKRRSSIADTGKALEMAGFSRFCLIRGNTHETLPKYFSEKHEPFDFAFIDGGHSVETIENDFNYIAANIEKGGVIILDDYYDPPVKGFGCNFIDGEVLPIGDKAGFATIHLMRVQM